MKTSMIALAALALTPMLASCHHKDLIYDAELAHEIRVAFDWRNAPDADPASMVLVLYDESTAKPMRFVFDNREGGAITVPYGKYSALCINGDINDWACFSHEDDIDSYEVSTEDAASLSAYNLASHLVPSAGGSEDERMAQTPGMVWGSRTDSIELKPVAGTQLITMYPDEAVCHYTVDVTGVENIQYVEGTNVDGVLSGMAEGYMQGRSKPADSHVTMPFVLAADAATSTLHSEFLTFGESHDTAYSHNLTVYLYLKDGSRWYSTYDVTDQVSQAPDPRHVHIVVNGLSVPQPTLSGGGLAPDVQDWNDVNVDIKM